METELLIADMLRPEAYPQHVEEVHFLQTHISLLFFAGDRVYKIKQAVDLGFLDYTSPAARKYFCEEEVRLNRRLAPHTYLGVVPLCIAEDGHLHVGSENAPSAAVPEEWAVAMRRLPEERMLSTLLDRGAIDNSQLLAIGRLLAEFHLHAATGEGVDAYGAPQAIAANVEENFAQLESYVSLEPEPSGGLLSKEIFGYLQAAAQGFLQAHRQLFLERVRAHAIREGHGDLHAGNICLTDQGVVIYDCIEFNRRFRCADVAADLAFLAMDLDHKGFRASSGYLVKRYSQWTQDERLVDLMDFYKGYRALVRAKVAAISSEAPGIEEPTRASHRLEAMGYIHLALGYELPPALFLMCGLPASGKSFVAKGLAHALGATLLQSDLRRKRLPHLPQDVPQDAGYAQGLYIPELKAATYASLLEDALRGVQVQRPVIVDASFSKQSFRSPFVEAAERQGIPYFLIWVSADEALTRQRMQRRSEDPRALSEANFEIYQAAKNDFEAPDEIDAAHLLRLNSRDCPLEQGVGEVLGLLVQRIESLQTS